MNQKSNEHIPVLLTSVLTLLDPKKGQSYLDLTAGYGGHATEVLNVTGVFDRATLVDRDEQAITALQPLKNKGVELRRGDFLSIARLLHSEGRRYDMILLDIGISSPHVDNAERGFSLAKDGPLDMRMDQSQVTTAADIVNTESREELVRILKQYGEEPRAQKVADAIIATRPHTRTKEFAEIVRQALPGPRQRVHPATKTFQAIRIAVNQELAQLEAVLPICLELLNPGGRLAVISFHSLEDRIVKQFIKNESNNGYESRVEALTKRPIDGAKDDVFNPRARSAKLRGALKLPR